MKRFQHLVMALSAALAMSCGAGDSIPEARARPAAAAEQTPSTTDSLARLRALEVVNVGALIHDVPAEATQCYGPCPGYEGEIARAREKTAKRLAKLVGLAEETADATPSGASSDPRAIKDDLATLNALRIVHVESLIEAEPENNPSCYNRPCQEDRDRAKQTTQRRAAHLAALAKAAKGL